MKKYLYIFLGVIVLTLCYFLCFNKEEIYEDNIEDEIETILEEPKVSNIICVDLKGAVNKPGVYCLEENNRILDVIEQSGGINSNADTSVINLSKKIKDEMTIIIYTKTQIKEAKERLIEKQEPTIIEIIKEIEKECICPDINNDACINQENNNEVENNELVNINTASKEQLLTLPGIGETKAQAILDYRENNVFETIDDLKKVKGIGETTFEALKEYITT